MPYIGRTLGQGTRSRFLYTATAGQTTFSGSDTQSNTLAYSDNNGVDCFQNGVLLKGGGADYTATSGTSVVLTTGASVNDIIEIMVYDVFAIADHVKKSGDAMTGALTNIDVNGTELILDSDGDTSITADTDDQIDFKTGGNDRVVIDASGNLMVAKTSVASSSVGFEARANGFNAFTRDGGQPLEIRRLSSDGDLIDLRKDSTSVGAIGTLSGHLYIGDGDTAISPRNDLDSFLPSNMSSYGARDNAIDMGYSSVRFDDIYATNGTIQTSDKNLKEDIASLTSAEMKVGARLSKLFKTFRWKNKVTEKGDKARTHSGIIAQDVSDAFTAEGLDATKYGLYGSNTWDVDKDGQDTVIAHTSKVGEKTRLSIRYPELLCFVSAYNEQRFTDIEARIKKLEDG